MIIQINNVLSKVGGRTSSKILSEKKIRSTSPSKTWRLLPLSTVLNLLLSRTFSKNSKSIEFLSNKKISQDRISQRKKKRNGTPASSHSHGQKLTQMMLTFLLSSNHNKKSSVPKPNLVKNEN